MKNYITKQSQPKFKLKKKKVQHKKRNAAQNMNLSFFLFTKVLCTGGGKINRCTKLVRCCLTFCTKVVILGRPLFNGGQL